MPQNKEEAGGNQKQKLHRYMLNPEVLEVSGVQAGTCIWHSNAHSPCRLCPVSLLSSLQHEVPPNEGLTLGTVREPTSWDFCILLLECLGLGPLWDYNFLPMGTLRGSRW